MVLPLKDLVDVVPPLSMELIPQDLDPTLLVQEVVHTHAIPLEVTSHVVEAHVVMELQLVLEILLSALHVPTTH